MNKDILQFLKDCAEDFDCDSDAHIHDTLCRACRAKELLRYSETIEVTDDANGWGDDLTNQL